MKEEENRMFLIGILDEEGGTRPIKSWSNEAWPWQVRAHSDGTFTARVKHREIFYCGGCPEEAIGIMLQSICEMGRKGSIDPANPSKPGAPPVQHAIELLEEEMRRSIEQRNALLANHGRGADPNSDGREALENKQFANVSNVIAGLATAIAALARIKEL